MHPVKNPIVTCPFKYVSKKKPSPWKAGYHPGVDYRASTGTPTHAPVDSTIINTTYDSSYGYKIVGECSVGGRKFQWIIAHHRKGGVHVKRGQKVKAGERIGSSGATGNTFGPHVHFEVRISPFAYANHVDPKVLTSVKGGPVSKDKMDPDAYFLGATGEHIWWLDERLDLHGFEITPSRIFTEADQKAVRKVQLFLGFSGGGADGFPGAQTLEFLATEPREDLPPDTQGPILEDPGTPLVVLARWAWTDTKNGRVDRPLTPSKVTSFTLHYPADGNVTYANLTQAQVAAKLEAYRKHHTGKGWADIGYNYAIDGQGRTWFLTGDTIGAHADSVGNTTSIGVLLVLGNTEEPTARMIEAFKVLYADKREKFVKIARVRGHQEVPGNSTACPGPAVMAAIKAGIFTEKPLPVPEPEPEPEPPPTPTPVVILKARTLTINGCADYCTNYAGRVAKIEKVRAAARASLVFTTESGSYADGERLNKAFGWGGKRNGTVAEGESFVLHGGSVPITTAVHFNPADYDVLDEGVWVTVPGSTHRWATWVLLRERATMDIFIAAPTHTQYLPKGPNTIRKYDKEREAQIDALMEHVEDLQAKVLKSRPELGVVPVLVPGDMNGKRNDPYDGPGKAAKRHKYVEVIESDDRPIIDRMFGQHVEVLDAQVLPTNGATDHETAFAAYVSMSNKEEP